MIQALVSIGVAVLLGAIIIRQQYRIMDLEQELRTAEKKTSRGLEQMGADVMNRAFEGK